MKKRRPVKHAHRKAMIAQRKAKSKFSKCYLPKTKAIVASCKGDDISFFFMHICRHCFARGKIFMCKSCVVWR